MPRKGKKPTTSSTAHGTCALCGRDQPLTEHHLIPRAVHGNRQFQKMFTREEMHQRRLALCHRCHGGIHRLIPDEKELARHYNTRETLLANERIRRHITWVRKQRN